MVKVKICGITETAPELLESLSEADFIGLVFAPSRRRISPQKGRELAQAMRAYGVRAEIVGVFVNAPVPEVNHIADFCRLDRVQLSGDEDWEYCRMINRPVIKAIRIAPDTRLSQALARVEGGIRRVPGLLCLLDAQAGKAFGGTGKSFDWRLATFVAARHPVLIAGGLDYKNVAAMIENVQPRGVDVSTGVETDGRKDPAKIAAFISAVREAGHTVRPS